MFDENVISYKHLLIPVSTFGSAGGVGIGRVALSSLERTEAEARLARLELEHSAALRAATDLAERTEAVAADELAIAAERRRASEPLPEDEEPVFCDLEALLNGLDEASSTAEDDTEDDRDLFFSPYKYRIV